jgi:hypothetical protein
MKVGMFVAMQNHPNNFEADHHLYWEEGSTLCGQESIMRARFKERSAAVEAVGEEPA